jgi:hypothetical protein
MPYCFKVDTQTSHEAGTDGSLLGQGGHGMKLITPASAIELQFSIGYKSSLVAFGAKTTTSFIKGLQV